MSDRTILIVGGGVAAGSTATTLREEGFDGRIVLVTDETRAPYERPPLSKTVLAGDDDPASTAMHEHGWYAEHDVELVLGRVVVSLGTAIRTATLDDGARVAYDDVVLATGASPRPSPVPGWNLAGAHLLRRAEDATALRAALVEAERVAIVGASWIGLEVAAAARGHGCEVTVLAQEDEPLEAVLGREVGAAYRALHEEHGVEFRMGTSIAAVHGELAADGVELGDGTHVPADAVVLGTGVRPNVALAEADGIAVDEDTGGIPVDAQLRTRVPHVHAIGDVAAVDHPRLGRLRVEHVEVARGHGQSVARVLLGQDVVHDELPLFYSDQYDLGMEYVGHATPDDVVVRGSLDDREFVAFYLDGDVVRAGTHADVWDATDVIRSLVGETVDRDVLADPAVPLDELAAAATAGG